MKSIFLAGALALSGAAASADTYSFYCFSEGDLGYEIIVDDQAMGVAQLNISGGYDFPDNERHQQLYAAHVEEGFVFRNQDFVLQSADLVHGMMFFPEFPNEVVNCDPALRQASAPVVTAPSGPLNAMGLSLGGRLRSGPGMGYASVGSLAENTPIVILSGTGVVMNGYEWFEIQTGARSAFQWGGIMCSHGGMVPGIYASC